MHEHSTTEAGVPNYLDNLSALAGRSFTSSEEAITAILTLITEQLDLRTSYLTHATQHDTTIEVIAAYNAPGGCEMQAGSGSMDTAWCSLVYSVPEPLPVVIADILNDPHFKNHPAAAALPNIGAYVGVPIRLSNGQLFGTLCAVDPQPHYITPQQKDLLIVLARLLATHIERDQELHERHHVEEALRESRTRYRTLVKLSPDTIAVLNSGKIVYLNPAGVKLLGATDEQAVLGRSILDFVPPDHTENITERIQQVRDGQFVPPTEECLLRLDGTSVPVEITAIPITYKGEAAGQVIARDISRRKRVEAELAAAHAAQYQVIEQLERLNKTKSHFVSIVSHEFRTALTGIQGFSEMMRDEDFTIDEMKEYAADINEDAKRLNRMITEMLDLDRMESGRMMVHYEPTDLNALLRNVVQNASTTASKHTFQLNLDPVLSPLPADRDKVTQVVTNLISNALKYSPNGGPITINSCLEGDVAHIFVQDHGVGLPPDALEKIFERYGRVETSATRYIQGTGLGLPISRQIVQLHGGCIWAESNMGQGSTFHFTLPLVPPPTND